MTRVVPPKSRNANRLSPGIHRLSILALLILCGCRQSGGESGSSVRDSAGVRVVYNAGAPKPWSMAALAPVVLADSARLNIYGHAGGLFFDDESGVAADVQAGTLHFFDSSGRVFAQSGRTGSGPGEFRSMTAPVRLPDGSVAVLDPDLRRVTILSNDGTQASVLPTPAKGDPDLIGRLPSGKWVFIHGTHFAPGLVKGQGLIRPLEPVVATSGDGVVDTVLHVMSNEANVEQSASRLSVFSPPYARSTSIQLVADRLMVATAENESVHVYDSRGRLTDIWQWKGSRAARDPVYEAEYINDAGSGLPEGGPQNTQRALAQRLVESRGPAPYDRVLIDLENRVWIRSALTQDIASSSWLILDSTGRVVGQMNVPEECNVLAIGRTRILCRSIRADSAELWLWRFGP